MELLTKSRIRKLKELRTAKGRKEAGLFLVSGKKLVAEATGAGDAVEYLATPGFLKNEAVFLSAVAPSGVYSEISNQHLRSLDSAVTPSGVMAVCRTSQMAFKDVSHMTSIACLVGIQDPGNLGTMIRTADWFGVEALIISSGSVDVYKEKAVASSMGSVFHLSIYTTATLSRDLVALRDKGITVIGTSPRGNTVRPEIAGRSCLVMGSESTGLSDDDLALCDYEYALPGAGKAESLNVGVSFGICLYSLIHSQK